MTIGGNLKKLRVAQGLTQDQLAEKLHVTRQAVSNWERNVSHPDLDQLEAIAAQYPTPFHIYDERGIRENARRLRKAFAWNPAPAGSGWG